MKGRMARLQGLQGAGAEEWGEGGGRAVGRGRTVVVGCRM